MTQPCEIKKYTYIFTYIHTHTHTPLSAQILKWIKSPVGDSALHDELDNQRKKLDEAFARAVEATKEKRKEPPLPLNVFSGNQVTQFVYVYMYVCMYVCMYVFMCVCALPLNVFSGNQVTQFVYVCMYVCMCLCVYVPCH